MAEPNEEKNFYLEDFERFANTPALKRSWVRPLRADAIARFAELGFPTTRDEDWRYTNIAPILRNHFRPAVYRPNGLTADDTARFSFGESGCCTLVFVDGSYVERLSSVGSLPRGTKLRALKAAAASDRDKIEPHLTHVAGAGNAFVSLNTAFMRDGALLWVPPGVTLQPVVHLVFLSTASAPSSVSYPRTLIVVGDRSQASIVETHAGLSDGVYFTNAVTEIVAGTGSIVDHYKLQRESSAAYHIGSVFVSQGRNSTFNSHSISLGGSLVRNDFDVMLAAEGAESSLNGLYVTKDRQHIDNHTSIVHARPYCTSRELYKGILDDVSTGVFNGRILVEKDAQKTNARQTNKNLLLSEDALVNTKPQLEIFADDVKCTHGATIGQLNEEELFYLRSRGIGEQSARTLLTYAFASEIVSAVKIKPIQCQIDLVLLNRLSRSRGPLSEIESPAAD